MTRWWRICFDASRPYVVVTYRRKYASVWSDEGTVRPWSAPEGWAPPHNNWLDHQDRLSELISCAVRRAIDAGYREWVASGLADISTCLAEDAAPLAHVLIEVWDGNVSGLERLHAAWDDGA